jgi:outer membrane protein TolC
VFSAAIYSQSNQLTIDQCLSMGLENSREIKISQSKLTSSETKITEVGSRMLPKLSSSASYYWISEAPINFSIPILPGAGTGDEPVNAFLANVTLEQPLFTGFRLSSLKSSAELNYKADEFEAVLAVNEKALEIHKSFWNLYKAQQLVELTEASYKSVKRHIRDTENFVNNGLAIESDLLKLKVHEANTEMKLIDAKNMLEFAKAALNKSIGVDIHSDTKVVFDSDPFRNSYNNFDTLLTAALSQRSELQSLKFRKEAGSEFISVAKADWWPQMFAFGGLYYLKLNSAIPMISNQENSFWNVGVSLKWDLWDWGGRSAKITQAEQGVFQTKLLIEQLKEAVKLDVYKNYLQLKSERAKINAGRLAVKAALENYRVIKNRYDQHSATATEIVDAQAELLSAQTAFETSTADYKVAEAVLNKSIGKEIH